MARIESRADRRDHSILGVTTALLEPQGPGCGDGQLKDSAEPNTVM